MASEISWHELKDMDEDQARLANCIISNNFLLESLVMLAGNINEAQKGIVAMQVRYNRSVMERCGYDLPPGAVE